MSHQYQVTMTAGQSEQLVEWAYEGGMAGGYSDPEWMGLPEFNAFMDKTDATWRMEGDCLVFMARTQAEVDDFINWFWFDKPWPS